MRVETPAFVAVDWGTSSLRLWLMAADGAVLAETRSAEGMGGLSPDAFEPVLRGRLQGLGPAVAAMPTPLRVVLCGMVGARQGWREAVYVDVPAPLDAVAGRAVSPAADGLDARILPGLSARGDRPDVMRGEETQLLGLVLDAPALSATVCMPGTHSKWVTLDEGRVAGFSTVMTGEFYALLAGQSILRHTVAGSSGSGDPAAPAFVGGLADGLSAPDDALARLFGIRAAGLLSGLPAADAADRLSGLLIGAEVGARLARADAGAEVVLVASGRLAALYAAALRAAGRSHRLVDADAAVRGGLVHAARALWPEIQP
ncbi:2-keto-3-deoxy-galactonokinase [Pleomorphomonas sp. SM30]|uniref:2-dehydro-3-deoxygalactonokinase n=2 Tax=Oharaeibacter diazotrophicus TaxID=1920512 RepID=A0A4R6RGD9_9HYPH|nr:2-dehydro-3-deoxygalactonokinase [Oharaeibacter diazotrophicus]BBE74275.1 2-keto-3-deoxy-galactonokinase [Pleomorphomonas sp. SM30]GLS76035.1 2-dehydro-3-deoxygalactonokinase [Oharaeibacter diazotrophicus]